MRESERTIICGSHANSEVSQHIGALICTLTGTEVHFDKEASGRQRDDVPQAIACDDDELKAGPFRQRRFSSPSSGVLDGCV